MFCKLKTIVVFLRLISDKYINIYIIYIYIYIYIYISGIERLDNINIEALTKIDSKCMQI